MAKSKPRIITPVMVSAFITLFSAVSPILRGTTAYGETAMPALSPQSGEANPNPVHGDKS